MVPQGIIYLLETVKVQKKQGSLSFSVAESLVQIFGQIDMEKIAVSQISQLVMICQIAELSFGFFPFRDVPYNTGHYPTLIRGDRHPEGDLQGKDLVAGGLPEKFHMVAYPSFLPFRQGKKKITADFILNPSKFSGRKQSGKGIAHDLFGGHFENTLYLGVGVDNTKILGNLDDYIGSCFCQSLITALQIFKFSAITANLLTWQGRKRLRFRTMLMHHDIFSLLYSIHNSARSCSFFSGTINRRVFLFLPVRE
jgi:hypothetical protein